MINSLLSYIFYPILDKFGPGFFILFISLFLAILTLSIYKRLTPQEKIKEIIENTRKLNVGLRDNEDNKIKQELTNKEIWKNNMEITKHSLLPNMLSFIPIILLFTWMGNSLSYQPIEPNTPFYVDVVLHNFSQSPTEVYPLFEKQNGVTLLRTEHLNISDKSVYKYTLQGEEGNYSLGWKYINKTYYKNVTITNKWIYDNPVKDIRDGIVDGIVVENKELNTVNFFGLGFGWFIEYFIFSLLFNVIFKKVMDIY